MLKGLLSALELGKLLLIRIDDTELNEAKVCFGI